MSEDVTLDEFTSDESTTSESEKEELARKTVCGIPPQDWNVAKLGDRVRVVSGNSLPAEYQKGTKEEYPVYKVSDMNSTGNQKYVSDTANRLSEQELDEINHTLYPAGTTILPKVGGALLTNKRRMLTEPSSFDNNVMGWVPDKLNPEFLYYVSCMIDMEAVAQKGAVPSISKAIAQSIKIPSPPLSEQCKISTVLYTINQAIEKSEEIIDQIRYVKQGTAQNLFKHGSFPHDTSQNTVVGEFPAEWELKKLGDLVDLQNGLNFSGDQKGDGTLLANVPNVYGTINIEPSELSRVSITESEVKKYELKKGDIITVRSSKDADGVGQVAIYRGSDEPVVFAGFTIRQRPKDDSINPEYLVQYLRYPETRKRVVALGGEVALTNISQSDLKMLEIPVPSKNEQRKIVDILGDFDSHISLEKDYINQLKRLKQGLMQDLLSGTVRTTDTNIQVLDEVAQYG